MVVVAALAALLLLAVLVVVAGQSKRQAFPLDGELVDFELILPRDAVFSVSQAAAWFRALAPLLVGTQVRPAVEIRSERKQLSFSVIIPRDWEATVRGQLAAWFPEARLKERERRHPSQVIALHLALEKPDLFPIHIPSDEHPDPLLGVIGVLTQQEESSGFRIEFGPPPSDWKNWAPAALEAAQSGSRLPPRGIWFRLFTLQQIVRAASQPNRSPSVPFTSDPKLAGAAAKVRDTAYSAQVVVWADGTNEQAIAQTGRLIAALATGYRDPFGNTLCRSQASAGRRVVLSARELAAAFHVPEAEHPLVTVELSRRVPPPVAMLQDQKGQPGAVTWLGEALLPHGSVPFGLGIEERRLHTYVVGKTGTGKSTLLATILRQDLESGRGVGLIDPHGDLAERILTLLPPERQNEVLYFNPADDEFPVGFNLLATGSPSNRPLVASAVLGVFKKLYGESWGPRLEYMLRNAILALLETHTPSLLGLPRLLTDRVYRTRVLEHVRDPLLRSFFMEEFEGYDPRWRTEAIAPILNKVGQFLSSPTVRHIVGQAAPGFNLRELMDRGGIFIANLASGKIGEDNAALLGGLLVAGFQLAAMSRADQPEAERVDFCLSVDEFQHFANDAFAVILSEARKYRLALTLSHQYLEQIPAEISDAVFGNAGTLCVFRVGAPDTARLVRELAPTFDAQDLIHLPNYRFCARINRRGETVVPFSSQTIPLSSRVADVQSLIEGSRRRWARPLAEVELEIVDLWEGRFE